MAEDRFSLQDALEGVEAKKGDRARAGRCFYCGQYATRREWDHFPIPYVFGGDQMVPACLTCHDLKDRLDILEWPPEALREAFEGLTPMAALLLGKCVALGLAAHDGATRSKPRTKPRSQASAA